jgi:signal peptidase I
LAVGHHAFVNKMAYRFSGPERGDIVVFPSPVNEEKDMVKRVIAVEGDAVEIKDKKVILNGKELIEPYIQHTRAGEILKGDNIGQMTVPRGHVFVLGDNRDESGDSRDWVDPATKRPVYFISVKNLKGKLLGTE